MVIVSAVLAAGPALGKEMAAPRFTVFFMDGTVLTGRLATTQIAIGGPDGVVRNIRSTNVRDLTPGFVSRPELAQRTGQLIAQLAARSWHDRKAAQQALVAMGPAVRGLLENHLKDGDLERRLRIEDILAQLRSTTQPHPCVPAAPRCPIGPKDRITLHESTEIIDGRLATQRIKIVGVYGTFTVDMVDINAVRRAPSLPPEPTSDKPDRIEVALVGGKTVKGTVGAEALTLQATIGTFTVPTGLISRLAFTADRSRVGVILRNGDHLIGRALEDKAITVKTPEGKTVALPAASVAAMSVTPGFVPEGLICWNRLDGTPSIIGPQVDFAKVDTFVEGKVAKGAQVSTSQTNVAGMRVPAKMLKEAPRGTIAFWTKLVSKPGKPPAAGKNKRVTSTIWYYEILGGPVSLTYRNYTTRNTPYVYLRSGGHYVRTDSTKKNNGAGAFSTVGTWNHVAVVWDTKGLKAFGGATMAMLINGKPVGKYYRNAMSGDPFAGYPFPAHLLIHRSRSTTTRATVVYDELKIWNRVVTDFTK